MYAGLGGGRTHRLERADETTPSTQLDGSLTKVFAQVNYAKKKQKPVHLFGRDLPLTYGAALRLSYVEMTNFRINDQLQDPAHNVFFRAHHVYPAANCRPVSTTVDERPEFLG